MMKNRWRKINLIPNINAEENLIKRPLDIVRQNSVNLIQLLGEIS